MSCREWAGQRGLVFEPGKTELVHFTRKRQGWTRGVALDATTTVQPQPSARFLGVILDSKLTWKAQLQGVQKKLETQSLALTRISALACGPNLREARLLYTAVIRPVIAYGSAVFHTTTGPGGSPRGTAAQLIRYQNKSLRALLGAYKATAVRG